MNKLSAALVVILAALMIAIIGVGAVIHEYKLAAASWEEAATTCNSTLDAMAVACSANIDICEYRNNITIRKISACMTAEQLAECTKE